MTLSDGVSVFVGHFYRGEVTTGKYTYPDGGVFEGRFHLGGRRKGIYTYPDGKVFKGEYTWVDVRPEGSRASTKGVLTYKSEDTRLDFNGDILALDPDFDDGSGRRGKLTWKDGSSKDGKWVAGSLDYGNLRCREFLGLYPLAFREFFSCPLYNDRKEGEYSGKFKDGMFHGSGCISWREVGKSGRSHEVPSGACGGTFKGGKLHGHCHWTKHRFWISPLKDAEIFFRGTAADGFIWPHVPSGLTTNDQWEIQHKLWDWPRPPQAGLRFKMNSKVAVNVGNDEWETASVKGFIIDKYGKLSTYIVWLNRTVGFVRTITDDNDDFIREVVTDFEVGTESHPYFGYFILFYSGPIDC